MTKERNVMGEKAYKSRSQSKERSCDKGRIRDREGIKM